MNEMVEPVSKALAEATGLDWGTLPDAPDAAYGYGMGEGCKAYWRILARAAIAAMREPTGGMLDAGMAHTLDEMEEPDMDSAAACWQTMIDAALGEPHGHQG